MAFVDANIILRFLLNDHKELSPKAEQLISRAKEGSMLITDIIVSEIWYVLRSLEIPRIKVAESIWLLERTPAFHFENAELVGDYVRLLANTKLDFADCYLAARVMREKSGLHSFDKELTLLLSGL